MSTPRQRLLTAINCEPVDVPPCSFMLYNGLKSGCSTWVEFLQAELDLGLDAYVDIPPRPPVVVNDYYNLHGLAVNYPADVEIREWKETPPEEDHPVLVKEYHTREGVLRAEVRQDPDWRWGDHVPFLDDYLVSRSRKFIVGGREDLAALDCLLAAPRPDEIAAFRAESAPALEFAARNDLLTVGGWGVGADMVGWLYGLQQMMFAVYDDPQFLCDLLNRIAIWNRQRMAVVLDAGVDVYVKRAWYENCDFWSPRNFRRFLLPILSADVDLAHRRGAKFGYIITSNCMPLLEMIAEAGVDVIIGADPAAWNLAAAKQKLAGRTCLWGGVNGHLTVEHGTPEQVRVETRRALDLLAPGGGFILSPVDNVREDSATARENVRALLNEWKDWKPAT